MNVLSLFDGKSSGYTALELAEIPITNYYSSEVDKYSIQVSNAIHPNQTRLGDVTKWREWDIDFGSIDLVIAGSPCQGFSFAGKQLAFDDPRSRLFFVFVDILNHVKSLNKNVKFLLENVKMKKEYMDVIDEQLGVESIMINSALVSAQNRQRNYWTNMPADEPIDKGILLADILEYGCKEKNIKYSGAALRGRNGASNIEKRKDDKSNTLLSTGHQSRLVTGAYIHNNRGLQLQQNNKSYSLVTNLAAGGKALVSDELFIRKLTPRECFRLQTVPERYIDKILACGVSNSQLYKIAGNGWTDEVIAHIFQGLKE